MAVFVFAANISFVHFNNAAELFDILDKSGSYFVAHEPRGFIGAEAHVAHDLQCAHALLGSQHEVRDLEPVPQRLVRVLKDRIDHDRKPIAGRTSGGALGTLPVPLARRQVIDARIAAAGAAGAFRPSAGLQVGFTGVLIGEHRLELGGGKLVDRLGASCHGTLPIVEGYCHA